MAMREPAATPDGALRECLVEDEPGERSHQAGLLRERQELEWRNQPEALVRPAHQGFGGDDLAIAEIDLGLIVEDEPLALDGGAQLLDEREAVAAVVDRRGVHLVCPMGELGSIHGDVGTAHQADAVARVGGRDCDADARADADAHPVEDEGLLEQRGQASGEPRRIVGVAVDQDRSQLVASDPHQDIRCAQRADEPWPELFEELVPGGVAEGVVDLLEVIQVDKEKGQAP